MFSVSTFEDFTAEMKAISSNAREAAASLQALMVTVHGKNRLFTVVANGEGKVQEFTFGDDRYRALSPAELGGAITEALVSLQTQVAEAAVTHLADYFPDQVEDVSVDGGMDAMLGRLEALGLLAPSPAGATDGGEVAS